MTWEDLDVIIIGAGFSGILALYRLRGLGFRVRGFERKDSLGGVWQENAYPGAAVDSPFPFYQFYDESLLEDWNWKEEFPTRGEMLRYFEHVDAKWKVSESFEFNATVTGAQFCEESSQWTVSLADGRKAMAKWLIPAVGFSSVVNIPNFSGIDNFRGLKYHTALWPRDAVDIKDKKVALIGTGPSGVQVIQTVGKLAKYLAVYQQSPCLTLRKYSCPSKPEGSLQRTPAAYGEAFRRGLNSFNGFDYRARYQDTLMVPAEERMDFYQKRYMEGGWAFWMGGFHDLCYDINANKDAYAFWVERTRPRIQNGVKRELLVPQESCLPFGVKRPCLEEDLYEVLDQPNVELINIANRPIEEITETGIRCHGETREFDLIILATGFDEEPSGLKRLSIRGRNGISIQDAWAESIQSFLGMAVHNFPNMFYLYGPQCPTLLVNSPAVITVQVEWLCQSLVSFRQAGIAQVEATTESQYFWRKKMEERWSKSLYCSPTAPGNKHNKVDREPTWIGGLVAYQKELDRCLLHDFEGFNILYT